MMYLRVFIALLLISGGLVAKERFADGSVMELKLNSIFDRYCSKIREDRDFCIERSLEYENVRDKKAPNFLRKGAWRHIYLAIKEFKKDSAKSIFKRYFNDIKEEYLISWVYEYYISIPFATKNTYTIAFRKNKFLGGAHGVNYLELKNYSKKTNRKIKLKDILLPNSKEAFRRIAQKRYRSLRGLKDSDSLREMDNWFQDKFILPENFAITKRGLLLHYNIYEIKPYSSGETDFLVPYSLFRDLIKPYSPIDNL